MASGVVNFFKVPHVVDHRKRVRRFRVFIRAVLLGFCFINLTVMLVGTVIKLGRGPPAKCAAMTDLIYLSTYTLMVTGVLGIGLILVTFCRTSNFRNCSHMKVYILLYVVIIGLEIMVVPVMAIYLFNQMDNIVHDQHHVFGTNDCLMAVQTKHQCCGFTQYSEWLRHFNDSNPGHFVTVDSNSTQTKAEGTSNRGETFPLDTSVFPESCQCPDRRSHGCKDITYIVTSNNTSLMSTNVQYSDRTTANTSNITSSVDQGPAIAGTQSTSDRKSAHIYTTSCFSDIERDLNGIPVSTGVSSLALVIVQILLFIYAFYQIHNLIGLATVSDMYRVPDDDTIATDNSLPESENSAASSESRSRNHVPPVQPSVAWSTGASGVTGVKAGYVRGEVSVNQ